MIFFITSQRTLEDKMAENQTNNVAVHYKAMMYLYRCLVHNLYYSTFESRAYPEEEECGHLGFIEPHFTEVNPKQPLGRQLSHTDPIAIPKLLPANCLDEDQYPWYILCSGPEGWQGDSWRHKLYEQFNVAAYKAQRSTTVYQDRAALRSEMSTVTGTALQTSYP